MSAEVTANLPQRSPCFDPAPHSPSTLHPAVKEVLWGHHPDRHVPPPKPLPWLRSSLEPTSKASPRRKLLITFQVQLWAPPFSRPGPLPGIQLPSWAPAPWLSPGCPRAGRSSRRRPIAGPVVTSPSPAVTCSGRPASATPWKGHLPTRPSVYCDCQPFPPEDRDPFLFGSRQESSFRSLKYPGHWEQFLACPVNSDGEITYR